MKCKNCGSLINEEDMFCKTCGSPVDRSVSAQPSLEQQLKGEATLNPNQYQSVQNNNQVNPIQYQPIQNSNQVNPNQYQPIQTNNQSNNSSYNQFGNGNYNPNNANFNQPKGNNIIGGVIALIVIIGILVGGYYMFKDKLFNNEKETDIVEESTYKVSFKGFELEIPDTMMYEKSTKDITLYDSTQNWIASFALISGNFNTLKTNKDKVKTNLENTGGTVNKIEVKTINNNQYLIAEFSMSGTNYIFAYTAANSSNVFAITICDKENSYNYSILEKITPVVKSATFVGEGNSIMEAPVIDSSLISELAQ